MTDMELIKNLRWWLTVTRVIESLQPDARDVLMWRLDGVTLDECRKRLVELGHKGTTKERVRQMESSAHRRIRDSLTPPTQGATTKESQ